MQIKPDETPQGDGQPGGMSIGEQVTEFREALKQTLNTVNLEIAAQGGEPQIDAVMRALISLQAEFIAMAPSRPARRMQIREAALMLPKLVALRVQDTGGDREAGNS